MKALNEDTEDSFSVEDWREKRAREMGMGEETSLTELFYKHVKAESINCIPINKQEIMERRQRLVRGFHALQMGMTKDMIDATHFTVEEIADKMIKIFNLDAEN